MLRENLVVETFSKGLSYSINNPNGNRSSKRTEALHNGVVDFFFKQLGMNDKDWTVKHEEKILCSRATEEEKGKTFSIDITLTHKKSGVNVRVLFKSIEKSYNKNRENFANTTVGEVLRIHGHSSYHGDRLRSERENDITIFFTILPQRVLKDSKAEKTKYTNSHIQDLRLLHKHTHQVCAILECEDGFNTLKQFKQKLTGNILNREEVCDNMTEIGANIHENIRSVRL